MSMRDEPGCRFVAVDNHTVKKIGPREWETRAEVTLADGRAIARVRTGTHSRLKDARAEVERPYFLRNEVFALFDNEGRYFGFSTSIWIGPRDEFGQPIRNYGQVTA